MSEIRHWDLEPGVRYIRRNGTLTEPLEVGKAWEGWLTDPETGLDYDGLDLIDGHFVFNTENWHDCDLMGPVAEQEEAA